MNTLIQGYFASSNDFQLGYVSNPVVVNLPQENHGVGADDSSHPASVSSNEYHPATNDDESGSSEGENNVVRDEHDYSDATFKFISQMLMEEEDLENKPCMLNDCLALQATEKSLYDALNNTTTTTNDPKSPNDHFTKVSCCDSSSSDVVGSFTNCSQVENPFSVPGMHSDFQSFDPFWISNRDSSVSHGELTYHHLHVVGDEFLSLHDFERERNIVDNGEKSKGRLRGKKNRYREEDSGLIEEHKSNKHLANNVGESEPLEMYDKVLLCSSACEHLVPFEISKPDRKPLQKELRSKKGRPRGGKKQGIMMKEVVDLRSLLMQCAQAVASYDSRTVSDLLARIRQHSSAHGDGTERLAHYFANALEARLAGTGTGSYYLATRRSAAETLKAYKTYITACPFRKMSNLLANKTIRKLAHNATNLHIVDFGILYGFQWPCLIQALSERPGGPPKLRITGIDFPQPGFRPAERVEDTGRRLARYCERFGVPFEYTAIAQKWETIKLKDLNIEKDELVVVNSLYRLQNVPDETVIANYSPRDAVLNLIKRINPDMFIHGLVNGTYNTPFFLTRFREALFHFSSMFDIFEPTVSREDENRLLFEEEVLGKDVMNIIACEGTERVARPETYKQWGTRNVRAGFRQLPLDQEILKYVKSKVKREYHKDFSVDEDGKWMLQGWKGRVIHAISYWKPVNE